MGQAAEGGRTVLFVSHNMAAVRNLCRRSILLYGGQVRMEGATEDVIAEYLSLMGRAADRDEIQTSIAALPTDPVFRLLTVTVSQRGLIGGPLGNEESVTVQVDFEVRQPVTGLRVYFDLCDEFEDIIIRSFHDEDADAKLQMPAGLYRSTAIIPGRLLAPRRYLLVVRAAIHNVRTCTGRGIRLGLNVLNTGRLNRAYPEDVIRSKLQPPISWHTETVERP
jgi:lipopolysaccharide transport system ATP-binding protein